jgi:hypothetical protein
VIGCQRPVVSARQPDWQPVSSAAPGIIGGLDVFCWAERGNFVTSVRGALDASILPALREYVLRIGHECVGRLRIDLPEIGHADLNLTVPVGTGRRASPLAGLLRLAAPVAEASTLSATRLDRQLHVYATAEAAITGAAAV